MYEKLILQDTEKDETELKPKSKICRQPRLKKTSCREEVKINKEKERLR